MYKRNRKLRKSETMRNLVKNVYLTKEDLIYPIFIEEGENIKSVYYAWQPFTRANLVNEAGLPCSTFKLEVI